MKCKVITQKVMMDANSGEWFYLPDYEKQIEEAFTSIKRETDLLQGVVSPLMMQGHAVYVPGDVLTLVLIQTITYDVMPIPANQRVRPV